MVDANMPFNEYIRDRIGELVFNQLPIYKYSIIQDIGYSIGQWMLLLALRFNASIISIDFSESMIEIAKKKTEMLGSKNVDFYIMDAANLIFQNNTFDLVFCVTALQYIIRDSNWKNFIRNLVRVTKLGGYVMRVKATLLKYYEIRSNDESYVRLRNEYVKELKLNRGFLLIERPIDASRPLLYIESKIITIIVERYSDRRLNFYSIELSKFKKGIFNFFIYTIITSMTKLIDHLIACVFSYTANLSPGSQFISIKTEKEITKEDDNSCYLMN
jgi:ubiquinone/menaquinone biosynthesis C-methylase UbiE